MRSLLQCGASYSVSDANTHMLLVCMVESYTKPNTVFTNEKEGIDVLPGTWSRGRTHLLFMSWIYLMRQMVMFSITINFSLD